MSVLRLMISPLLALVASLLTILGTVELTHTADEFAFGNAIFWLVIGIVLFILALTLTPPSIEFAPLLTPESTAVLTSASRRRWFHALALVIGVACLVVLGDISGSIILIARWITANEHFQFTLLIVGSLLMVWGASGGWRWWTLRPEHAREAALILALFVFAFALRGINMERTIPGFVDEVSFTQGLPVFDFTNGDVLLMQPINSVAAFPRLYVYFQWVSLKILGHDLNTFRLPTAIFGALTIPALYALCCELFNRRVALVAALLLAVFPLHIQMSRVGLNNVGDPLIGTLAFWCLVRGLREGGRANFAFAGLFLGWTQYFHEAGRLTLPAIMLVWMGWIYLSAPRETHKALRGRLLIVIGCAMIAMIPYYWTMFGMHTPFAARVGDVGLNGQYWQTHDIGQIIRETAERSAKALARILHRPELILYYAGETPYIPYILTPILALGIAAALAGWSKAGRLLLLLWIAVPMGGIVVFLSEIMSPRTTVFHPALMALAALGLVTGAEVILKIRPVWVNRAIIGVTAALCIGLPIFYFANHLPSFIHQMYSLQPYQRFIFETRKLPQYTELHVITDPLTEPTYLNQVIKFIAGQTIEVRTHLPQDLTPELLESLPRDRNLGFMVQMPNPAVQRVLQQFYPDLLGPFIDEQPDEDLQWFVLYIVPNQPPISASSGNG